MGDLAEVVRNRRMSRAFTGAPVDPEVIDRMVDLASRAPSAGKTQGWHLVVLSGEDTARYWDATLPEERRAGFAWPGLLLAPVVMVVVADPEAYLSRYAEPDKAHTGLGESREAWPVPYWTVDASMAAMVLLLAAEDEGLGALFFGPFGATEQVRTALGIPDQMEIVATIALGEAEVGATHRGRSAGRARRAVDAIVHRSRW
jgi:nitroreductase